MFLCVESEWRKRESYLIAWIEASIRQDVHVFFAFATWWPAVKMTRVRDSKSDEIEFYLSELRMQVTVLQCSLMCSAWYRLKLILSTTIDSLAPFKWHILVKLTNWIQVFLQFMFYWLYNVWNVQSSPREVQIKI